MGHRLVVLGQSDSTNLDARRLLDLSEGIDPKAGLWVVALRQTQGRGRGGRWIDLDGNLAVTFACHTPKTRTPLPLLSLLAGIALHDAVASCLDEKSRADLGLKWPNDLLLAGRKCAGILCECHHLDDVTCLVIGWGVNCAAHPPELKDEACDLSRWGRALEPEALFERLTRAWSRWYATFRRADVSSIRKAWLARTAYRAGTHVAVEGGHGAPLYGQIDTIGDDGALWLRVPGRGVPYRVASGSLRLAEVSA